MFLHPPPEPRAAWMASSESQEMESNVLRKLSLRAIEGARRLRQHYTSSKAKRKLSVMFLPRMKPVWSGETRSVMNGCSREVWIFDAIFGVQFCRLTGRKSPAASAACFFGRRTMKAQFAAFRVVSPARSAVRKFATTSFIVGQNARKNQECRLETIQARATVHLHMPEHIATSSMVNEA